MFDFCPPAGVTDAAHADDRAPGVRGAGPVPGSAAGSIRKECPMPPAARIGDPTSHGGIVTAPPPSAAVTVTRVRIGGRPAAVVGSLHTCPTPPHAAMGPANVIVPNPAALATGTVFIGGMPAARAGDRTACGANVLLGAPNVLIGGS